MPQENPVDRHDARRKFLQVAGCLWLAVMLLILLVALTAPYMGRMADFVLHQTVYRDWWRLTLKTQEPFFDLSSPQYAVKSYYSALYRGDAKGMGRLTAGPFRAQMQLRLAHSKATSDNVIYRSYLFTETPVTAEAVVTEKFHLFWQRGLQFNLQHRAADWRIAGVNLIP